MAKEFEEFAISAERASQEIDIPDFLPQSTSTPRKDVKKSRKYDEAFQRIVASISPHTQLKVPLQIIVESHQLPTLTTF